MQAVSCCQSPIDQYLVVVSDNTAIQICASLFPIIVATKNYFQICETLEVMSIDIYVVNDSKITYNAGCHVVNELRMF